MRHNQKAKLTPSREGAIFDLLQENQKIANAVTLDNKYYEACGACNAIYYVFGVLGYTPEEVNAGLENHKKQSDITLQKGGNHHDHADQRTSGSCGNDPAAAGR